MVSEQVGKEWVQVALDLTSGISDQDRFERLLLTIRNTLQCDASALLLYSEQHFIPLAISGLSDDVIGRRFAVEQHPRFEAIARAGDIVRFPSDSELPDPYDGLIPNHEEKLKVHSCIGLPLMLEDRLIGAVTIDAFDPSKFNHFKNDDLRIISALAASSLNTALLMDKLEKCAGISVVRTKSSSKSLLKQDIIGVSDCMNELKSQIDAVSDTDLSVLIMGETGVGKELVAHALHNQSRRFESPLVYLNCAALPESVAESELFGHVKGAFTGAISHRKGKFELADKGTLFLDEIGELSLSLQAKLLRALQYGDIQRVGDDKNIKVDVRIIAATNRLMHDEVSQGRFRADLYHRLSVFPLFVPALRERIGDIALLAGFFAERCAQKLGVVGIVIHQDTLELIKRYAWPGNVRELEHSINRASVIAKSEARADNVPVTLEPKHFNFSNYSLMEQSIISEQVSLSEPVSSEYENIALKEAIDLFKSKLIESVYREYDGNLTETAKHLKVDVGNLHRLMKRLNLR